MLNFLKINKNLNGEGKNREKRGGGGTRPKGSPLEKLRLSP
ncbi:hypothetical protein CDSM653_01012 [Caldanaerobacter subterraneus subsp. pacificus DSM 12653]|uniref:Uncharacterized protein n=1 Tax=Caldanaerobacter subterraneus subsp. pacificus DSM 12653 TaxID=391606 RepID=A0A0F5PMW4_9THEO|nr:hypothetical protein CDSM653_01012 [Caldanaerobacter subterraneus subsp. pacificus DSM 12653]